MYPLTAVIFDIDGTLTDSVDIHAMAWQEALRHFGHEIPYEKIRRQIGKGGDQLLQTLLSRQNMKIMAKSWMISGASCSNENT